MPVTALNNLQFQVSLIDRISGPMGRVMRSVDQATAGFQSGFQKIGYGAAGLAGAAYSVNGLLGPTKEMQKALGEVKSLDVANQTLSNLQKTALEFSNQYGESAVDFVRSSYDIKSAIDSLQGNELPAFTRAGAILAKSSKAQVADMTNYMGTMYNIFQANAEKMGKAQWVEQLTGQTALAVKIFKVEGKGMADAFTGIGAAAQNNGIAMVEQMAILGQLQGTMSGSEAGTRYRAFLDGVGKAQDELNLKFTDAQGKMLPIIDILEKIKGKYGAIDTVAESDALKKAFGTQEAVAMIKLLSLNIDGLKTNIGSIGDIKGMQNAIDMAQTMADPWDRMRTGVTSVSTTIGTELLPMLLPVIASVNETLNKFIAWSDVNPELSKTLGILALGVFGVIGSLALFSIAAGWATVVSTGWGLAMNLIFSPIKSLVLAVWGAIPAIWSFTAAILANPITWWVLGITALIAVVAAAVIYWKNWTAVVVDFGGRFLEMIGVFALVDNALIAWEGLKNWWSSFKVWLAGLNPFNSIIAGLNSAITLANHLPGVNIKPISTGPVQTSAPASPKGGGIIKQMSSVMNANKSSSVGEVHVHNYASPMSGAKLRDELLFAGG